MTPADVLILAPEWRTRALLRAQLIEEGLNVIATDSWPMMKDALARSGLPRAAIVDLQHLADPLDVLQQVRALIPHGRVLVVTATGTLTPEQVGRHGFRALGRPVAIREIVAAATGLLAPPDQERR